MCAKCSKQLRFKLLVQLLHTHAYAEASGLTLVLPEQRVRTQLSWIYLNRDLCSVNLLVDSKKTKTKRERGKEIERERSCLYLICLGESS